MTRERRSFPEGAIERVSVSTRTTVRVRDRLNDAAKKSGRSVSQEIEQRLAESLIADDVIARAFDDARNNHLEFVNVMGGPATFSLAQDIAYLMEGLEEVEGQEWHASAEMRAKAFRVLEAALPTLLRAERPTKTVDIGEGIIFRAVELARFLPERPRPKPVEAPKDARFMTDDELKRFFYLNEDNA